ARKQSRCAVAIKSLKSFCPLFANLSEHQCLACAIRDFGHRNFGAITEYSLRIVARAPGPIRIAPKVTWLHGYYRSINHVSLLGGAAAVANLLAGNLTYAIGPYNRTRRRNASHVIRDGAIEPVPFVARRMRVSSDVLHIL